MQAINVRAMTFLGLIFFTLSCASAQTEMKGRVLSPNSSVADVLDALDQVGQGLKDFDARVSMAQEDSQTGEESKRTGNVWFQQSPDGQARVRVRFDKHMRGRKIFDEVLEYVLDQGWLIDRNYKAQTEVRRQVLKPGQKINLLKLGEGPFPLPIGQKKEDVLAQFDVKKVATAAEDPADTVHLELSPKKETGFAKKFKAIDVWVNAKSHMPARIATLDANETTIRTTDLAELRVNPGLVDKDFALPNIDRENWNRTTEPFGD